MISCEIFFIFHNKIIWNYTSLFADLFNDMEVWVYDENGKANKRKEVPVYLTPKEKVVAMIQRQGTSDTFPGGSAIDNYLPSITIVWTGIRLDNERLRGQREKRKIYVKYEDNQAPQQHIDLQTVPYILNYDVTIWAKYMDDAAQLLENILPFFHPEAYISIFEKSIGTERKCKVQLESITPNFVYEMDGNQRRIIQFNLGFSVEVNMYKPELPVGKPILDIDVKIATANNRSKAEGEVINTSVSGANTYYDFDDEIFTKIRNLTDDESFNIANKYFNKVSNSNELPEYNSKIPEQTVSDVLKSTNTTNFNDIIKMAGLSVPVSASSEEYTKTLLKSLYILKDNESNPLAYGNFTVKPDGTLEFIP